MMPDPNSLNRQEVYTLQGGEGLFEFRGGRFDQALLFRGTPVALLWCDCQGSIGQFLVRSGRPLDVSAQLRHLRYITDGGFDPDLPIASQITPLLALFADGPYRLTYQARAEDSHVFSFDEAASLCNHRDDFYPWEVTLVTTRPQSSLNPARMEYYRGRIAAGARPVLLTARATYADFVLDGHHKLAAYQALDFRPAVLGIEPLKPPPVTDDVARHAFAEAPAFYEGYLRLKDRFRGQAAVHTVPRIR